MKAPFIDRANTNERVLANAEEQANAGINLGSPKYKRILKLSEYYERQRRMTAITIIKNKVSKGGRRR